jgi:hypothetical protein
MIKENICSYHGDIILLAKKIKNINTISYTNQEDPLKALEDILILIHEIKQDASQIYELTKLAKKRGQRMEDRLRLYREAIEGLGFERKKRKKYERK